MARGINKAIIIGHLGADVETRYMPSGTAVANISVATTESWKDKQSGERQERTEWHKVTLFGRTAEVAGEYLRKGSQVYIEGRIQTDKWQDQSGTDRYTTKIIARDMQMLGGKGQQGGGRQSGGGNQDTGAGDEPDPQTGQSDDFDDDIPFIHAWIYPAAGVLVSMVHGMASLPGMA